VPVMFASGRKTASKKNLYKSVERDEDFYAQALVAYIENAVANDNIVSRRTIVWSRVSDPFGETVRIEGDQTFNLRFPGQYHDAESGLDYNGFRSYNSETGRYTQSDPIGLDGGINTYGYVDGNPVSLVDPTGEFSFTPIIVGAGIGVAIGKIIAKIEGCDYGAKDAALDAILGATGIGLLSKINELNELRNLAKLRGLTGHGAERIAGPLATRGGVLSAAEAAEVRLLGQQLAQADGASVYILKNSTGQFEVAIYNKSGLIITTFKNLTQKALDRLARNYGWH